MDKPLVSIIIPCFNYGHLIKETLNCLLDQSYTNWEAIIIDDGSIDNTNAVVKDFCEADKRFSYLYQTNNGVSAARNRGIELSKGEYIQLLDADDLISPSKIEIQENYMHTHPDHTISYTDAKYFASDNLKQLYAGYYLDQNEWMPRVSGIFEEILPTFIMTIMPINSPLIRASFLKENSIHFKPYVIYEDWEFWLNCLYKGARYSYIDNNLARALIRVHKNSARTHTFNSYFFDLKLRKDMNSYLQFYKGADKNELLKFNRRNLIYACRKLIRRQNHFSLQGIKIAVAEVGVFSTINIFLKELNSWRQRKF